MLLVVSGGWSSGVTRPKQTVVSPILAKTTPEKKTESRVTTKNIIRREDAYHRINILSSFDIHRAVSGGFWRILAVGRVGRAGPAGGVGRGCPGGGVQAGDRVAGDRCDRQIVITAGVTSCRASSSGGHHHHVVVVSSSCHRRRVDA